MAKYSIRIKRSALKELEAVSTKADRLRIIKRIETLGDNPRPAGCMKLSVRERYRIRQGRYRILYTVDDGVFIVLVIKIGHRKHDEACKYNQGMGRIFQRIDKPDHDRKQAGQDTE